MTRATRASGPPGALGHELVGAVDRARLLLALHRQARVEHDRDVHPLHGGLDHVDHVLARHRAADVQLQHDRRRASRRRCAARPALPSATARTGTSACSQRGHGRLAGRASSSSISSTRLAPARAHGGGGAAGAASSTRRRLPPRPRARPATVASRPRISSCAARRRGSPRAACRARASRRSRAAMGGCAGRRLDRRVRARRARRGRGIGLSGVPGGSVALGLTRRRAGSVRARSESMSGTAPESMAAPGCGACRSRAPHGEHVTSAAAHPVRVGSRGAAARTLHGGARRPRQYSRSSATLGRAVSVT